MERMRVKLEKVEIESERTKQTAGQRQLSLLTCFKCTILWMSS